MPLRRFACIALVLLAGCGSGGSEAPATDKAARSILSTYQVPAMLAQAAPIISDSLKANLPAQVGKQERQRLQQAVQQSFAKDKLAADLAQRLQAAAEQADKSDYLTRAAKSLDAKLPKRMIALEDAAASDKFAKGFSEFLQTEVDEDDEKRMQRIQKLADDLRLVNLQTGFNVGMLRGMVRARNAAAPEDYRTSDEVMQHMIEETRNGLHKSLQDQLPVMLFYAYRDVSDETVADYAQLQSQPALQWVNKQIAQALEKTLATAADHIGERYRALAESEEA